MVGDFGSVSCRLLSLPHDVVQVWKVMIQVDPFITVPPLGPAGQFRALQRIYTEMSYFALYYI